MFRHQDPHVMNSITEQINRIEYDRIGEKMDRYIAQGKLTNLERDVFIRAAMSGDESRIFAILDAKPAYYQKTRARFRPSAYAGERFQNLYNECQDPARVHDEISRLGFQHFNPRNENTIASALITNFLITGATTQAHDRFAPLKIATRLANPDPYKPLASGVLKLNTTTTNGSTVQSNATNFESGDSTLSAVTVSVAHLSASFHVRNTDLNDGIRMEDLAEAQLANLGDQVTRNFVSNITAANFPIQTPVIRTQSTFGYGETQQLWGQIKKGSRKQLLIDGTALANVTNVPSLCQPVPEIPGISWRNLLGWDRVCLNSEWTGAGNTIYGFACAPTALAIISGMPLPDSPDMPGGILARAEGVIPDLELSIAAFSWFNLSTRTYWSSYDIAFGSGVLDDTIGVVISSSTPT
jgi:hypothetical protein